MRRFTVVAFLLAINSVALAQNPPKPVEETITSADGVKLKGLFHASPGAAAQNNAVVLLLYQPGVGNSMLKPGDWDGLTGELVKAGFHVFRFDWRGHGLSTNLNPAAFWGNNDWNLRYVKGAKEKPQRNTLNVKEFNPNYFPAYAQDLAAVRQHLDAMNDLGTVNTGSIYVVGVGDTAGLGLLWLAAEWVRPAVHPMLGNGVVYKIAPTQGIIVDPPAGEDFAGAIWLGATRPAVLREQILKDWVKNTTKLRTDNPMLFLHGGQNEKGEQESKFYFDQVLVAKGNKALGVPALGETFMVGIKDTKLNGVNLLGANVGTEETILKYLAARQKGRGAILRKPRNYTVPYAIDLGYFGLRP